MKFTKSKLGVMINSLDYSRKVLISNNQDTLETDNLILKLVDIYEILEKQNKQDNISGNCFVIGDDFENAGFRSLTEEEIKKAKDDLSKRMFKYNKEKIHIDKPKTNKSTGERC